MSAVTFDFTRGVFVMAIVNRTPDSFYDEGSTFAFDAAVTAALAAAAAGADIVDIGGVPFGRGPAVTLEEELHRVIPVVAAVRAASAVAISVDTFNADVAREAIAAGAGMVNDTSGLFDSRMADVVAATDATLVITHSLAPPRAEPPCPEYDDVTAEVVAFLRERVARALAAGISPERIVVDPGHDLNKNSLHSLELTRRLDEIVGIGQPVLVAVSNKDFVGETLDLPKRERLEGSIAVAVACVLKGARIVRVHEVAPTVAAMRMTEAVLGLRQPAYLKHNYLSEERVE
jgi:dihydropteroate synthase